MMILSIAVMLVGAQTTSTSAPPAVEKKICRSYTQTGSIMPAKRVCHTKAEWSAIDHASGETTDELRDRSFGNPSLPH